MISQLGMKLARGCELLVILVLAVERRVGRHSAVDELLAHNLAVVHLTH